MAVGSVLSVGVAFFVGVLAWIIGNTKSRRDSAKRVLVTCVLLPCIAAFLMWQLRRPCDPRLVGSWTVTPDPRNLVRMALASMEPTDREVLVMWHLEELSTDEIASVLQLTVEGVKSRHRRALLRLTTLLNPKREER